jgi:hypothetical protein
MDRQTFKGQERKHMRERKTMRQRRDFDPRVEYLQDFREPGNLARRRHARSRAQFRVEEGQHPRRRFGCGELTDRRNPGRRERRMDMDRRTKGLYRSDDPHRPHVRHAHRRPYGDVTRRTTRDLIIEKDRLERRLAHLEWHLHAVKRALRRRLERRNRPGARMSL